MHTSGIGELSSGSLSLIEAKWARQSLCKRLILANKHIQLCFGLREADASVVRVGLQEVVADCEKLIAKISGHGIEGQAGGVGW